MATNNTEGAVTGLREAGMTPTTCASSDDVSEPILQALDDGAITGLVQYPYGAGVRGVDTAALENGLEVLRDQPTDFVFATPNWETPRCSSTSTSWNVVDARRR